MPSQKNALFVVHEREYLRWPRAETPAQYIAMGLHADLTKATKMAVQEMIDFLMQEKHLSRDDAYMLTSVRRIWRSPKSWIATMAWHMPIPKEIFIAKQSLRVFFKMKAKSSLVDARLC